ncbi:MAG: Cof-type HAD-IIB family hydrolase [Sporolactobacillus sp.]|jgi:Cof subfamily protein (haloacid dehalogenase superfamily)|nr:Cof-type HAD-IIB family hydrolase [Sporolactobacillus sp.]
MGIRLVFSDIDGTLLNSRHKVSGRTAEAIKELTKKNIPVILVSARMPSGILPLQRSLGINAPIVCYGGALILDAPDRVGRRAVLRDITIPVLTVRPLHQWVREQFPSVCFCTYVFDNWLVPSLDDSWVRQEQAISQTSPLLFQFDNLADIAFEPVHKVLCMGNPDSIAKLEEALKQRNLDVALYQSKPTYLEITAKSAGKSSAVVMLTKYYGLSREETLAFGDQFNDVGMLRAAGTGIAMGNAPDEVQRAADRITLSNNEDGLRKALETLGVIASDKRD